MNLRIRRIGEGETVPGTAYLYVGNQSVDTPAVLEFYGEVEQSEAYDGPTIFAWQPVPIVSEP